MSAARKTKVEQNAEELVQNLDEPKRSFALSLAVEVLWQAEKLRKTRREIGRDGVTVRYDNGGGQTGTRRNPAFDGYNALFKSYVLGLNKLEAMLGDAASEGTRAASTLQALRLEITPMRPNDGG